MKANISKIICALLSLVLVFSMTACGASKGFTAKAESNWGDLCRSFDSEWYESLAEEVRAQCDETLLNAAAAEDSNPSVTFNNAEAANFTSYGEVYGKLNNKYGSRYTTGLELMVNAKSDAVDYTANVFSTVKDASTDMTVIVAIADAQSGKYIAFDKATVSAGEDVTEAITGSFANLESGHNYKVQAIAAITPPENCKVDGNLYITNEVSTAK